MDAAERRRILDALGHAAGNFRRQIYTNDFSGRKAAVAKNQLLQFISDALAATDESIRASRRADGLYHSYNLAEFGERGSIPIRRLNEMLEGQAAILGANFLSA